MRIYLDFNASTPAAPEVATRMGAGAPRAVRESVKGALGGGVHARCRGDRTSKGRRTPRMRRWRSVFTSGGSEANNDGIKGAIYATRLEHPHIFTTQIEHPAVVGPCRFLERLGAKVTYVSVDAFGRVDPPDVRRAVTPSTILNKNAGRGT
jgi:cysteine desulfurase